MHNKYILSSFLRYFLIYVNFLSHFLVLRPPLSSPFDVVNDIFSLWKRPVVQQALSQVYLNLKKSIFSVIVMCSCTLPFLYVYFLILTFWCIWLQIVATLSSPLYHPLLHACAGYLSSFSQSHVCFSHFILLLE